MFWTHNDSGDNPRLFAFRLDGKAVGEVSVQDAKAVDWEDICYFQSGGGGYVAVADVGDNSAVRKHISIYILAEADLVEAVNKEKKGRRKVEPKARLKIRYEDGPVNCEALAYDPVRRAFVLVTKESFYARVYECPITSLTKDQDVVAKRTQKLLVPLATGADISADGKNLVVSTYGPAMHYHRPRIDAGELSWVAAESPAIEVPARKQGESICFAQQATKLLLTSEFAPTPLIIVDAPIGLSKEP